MTACSGKSFSGRRMGSDRWNDEAESRESIAGVGPYQLNPSYERESAVHAKGQGKTIPGKTKCKGPEVKTDLC